MWDGVFMKELILINILVVVVVGISSIQVKVLVWPVGSSHFEIASGHTSSPNSDFEDYLFFVYFDFQFYLYNISSMMSWGFIDNPVANRSMPHPPQENLFSVNFGQKFG